LELRKVKVEVEDIKGNKYTFTVSSPINRDKIIKFIDLVEMMAGSLEIKNPSSSDTKFEKILQTVKEHYPFQWFTSTEVQLAYEEKFKEPISLSTVSTYLSRYWEQKILTREGSPASLRYRLNPEVLNSAPKQERSG
jgi:hypothetical protein